MVDDVVLQVLQVLLVNVPLTCTTGVTGTTCKTEVK